MAEANLKERSTYVAETNAAGGNNKDALSILNPSGSGKLIKVRKVWMIVPSSTGNTVIIPWEIRSMTAHSGGTDLTSKPFDSTNPTAAAEVKAVPASVTDHPTAPLFWTLIKQINAGYTQEPHWIQDISGISELQPIVLREGEGLYFRQLANNTSAVRVGIHWTEEKA